MAAHIDFTTRRSLEDLLPAAGEPEPVPIATSPLTTGATLADIPGARTPDVFMVLGSLGVFAWTIVASEIVLLVH